MTTSLFRKAGTAITKVVCRTGLKIRKHSPEILLTVGVVGVVACVVLACKETLKADDILDKHAEELVDLNEKRAKGMKKREVERETTMIYLRTTGRFARLYSPSVGVGIVAIGCIVGAHRIQSLRIAGLTVAYNALDATFKAYRQRVIDDHGKETDFDYIHGIKKRVVEKVQTNDKGETEVVREEEEYIDKSMPSRYARFFDQSCDAWEKNPTYNLDFLVIQQQNANDLLHSRGHLFLNEVYDMLDIPRTPEGSVVGWLDGAGDNYVDFGLYDQNNEATRRFVNGLENVILLDFNVDGVIYNKI